jgi:outer membrane protein TolC
MILFLCSTALSLAQQELTLEQAQQRALAQHGNVRIAALAVEQASHGIDAARARRLPRLDVSAGYTHISETASIDLAIPGLPARSIAFGDGNVWETAVTASVPLFTGFRLSSAQDAAHTQTLIAEEALLGTRTALRHRVALVYRQAQLARRSAKIYREQVAWLREQLTQLKQLYAQGQLLSYDTLQLSTRIGALLLEESTAEAARDNALLTLAELTMLDADGLRISEAVTYDETPFLRFEEGTLADAALGQRADYRILTHQQDLFRQRIRAEESSYYPVINAFASYRYGRPGVDQISNEWMNYYTAGVSLQWNLWSWSGDKAAVEQQNIALEQSAEKQALLQREILASLNRIVNDIKVLRRSRVLLDEQVRQQQVKQDLLRARFAQGLATATEVVDAETALTTARLQREQSEIRYAMKLTELAAETGWNE